MPTPIVVPKATISMDQGTILQWTKKVGEQVKKDESLLELETDKAVVELPSPVDGTVLRISKDRGDVAVDQIIGWIGTPGEAIPDEITIASRPKNGAVRIPPSVIAPASSPQVPSTPAARRRAKELGIDLPKVKGSGPGGRITEDDVERVAAGAVEAVSSNRRTLSEHVTEAWAVPHIHIVRLMDATGLVKTKEQVSTESDPVTYSDLVLFTVAKVLLQFPQLCSRAESESGGTVALAFAVDNENGVVTPAIKNANALSLLELAKARRDLTSLAASRKLKPEHLQPANFTVTNLGMFEVDLFAPIINTPQVAILATGQIKQQPVAEYGLVRLGWRMWATVAADHRHIDGALAAKFLLAWQAEIDRLPKTTITQ
jgi:pyruvate dehydrogenase E2 component (dihydrolipoamide acetyltransferase)